MSNARPAPWHRALASAVDRLLDPTVAFSFDQTGFRRHEVNFQPGDLEVDLRGRVALVTGANSGLGKAAAESLARLGAQVWMLCRDRGRGEQALAELRRLTRGELHLAVLDVGDLSAVRRFAEGVGGAEGQSPARVDILVHNAGALLPTRQFTSDGLEQTLATHLVGPYALTVGLLDRMRRPLDQPPARIVWVSSGGMYTRRLSVERLGQKSGPFDGVTVYADVKRAQVVLNELLAGRLVGLGITSNAMHPGWAGTPGVASSLPVFHAVTRRLLRTAAEGADTVVWLAACPRIADQTGRFWFDRRAAATEPLPGTQEPAGERARLWQAVQEWSGVHWSEG